MLRMLLEARMSALYFNLRNVGLGDMARREGANDFHANGRSSWEVASRYSVGAAMRTRLHLYASIASCSVVFPQTPIDFEFASFQLLLTVHHYHKFRGWGGERAVVFRERSRESGV